MINLLKDYEFFKANLESITKGHIGEFVVVKDCAVLGYFKTQKQAIETMKQKGHEIGTFILQECVKNINDNKVVFHSRVELNGV